MASAGGNDFGSGAVVVEERIREDLVILVSNAVSGQEWEKLGLDVARMLAAWKGSD